jgi:uncharacterized integral membrane protein
MWFNEIVLAIVVAIVIMVLGDIIYMLIKKIRVYRAKRRLLKGYINFINNRYKNGIH